MALFPVSECVQGLVAPSGLCRNHQDRRVSSDAADMAPCSRLKYDIYRTFLCLTYIYKEAEQTSYPCDRTVNLPMEGCDEETPFWVEELGNSSDIHSAEQNHKHTIFTPVTSMGFQYWWIQLVSWGNTYKTSVRPSAKQQQSLKHWLSFLK